MPAKQGEDYEHARWDATSLLAAQRWMMERVLARMVAPRLRGKRRILEIGPGAGTWTKYCLAIEPDGDYTLLDISREMLIRAEQALAGKQNIQYTEGDVLSYTSERPFDFIFSSRAIEYVDDKSALATQLAFLLEQGGEGVLITKMPKLFFDWLRGRSGRAFHSGQVNPARLTALLREAGFTITSVRIATATVPAFHSPTLNKIVFTLLSFLPLFPPFTLFAESYLISFKKP